MGRFGSFLLGLVLGGAAVFGSLKYHIVHAEKGVHFVPKLYANLDDIYVDIREFDLDDWNEHKSLAAAIVKADKSDLLGESVADQLTGQLQDSVDGLLEGFSGDSP